MTHNEAAGILKSHYGKQVIAIQAEIDDPDTDPHRLEYLNDRLLVAQANAFMFTVAGD